MVERVMKVFRKQNFFANLVVWYIFIYIQGIVGGFFATAVITVAARMSIRIKSRRGISLDDYFLLFGLTCLTGATALLLKYTRLIYMTEAVRLLQQTGQKGTAHIPAVIFTLGDILEMANVSKVVDAVVCLTWSATFAVKASFLALFRMLIRRISRRITIYYWVVVGCTGVTWVFMMAESFIFCSTFGLRSSKCFFQHFSRVFPLVFFMRLDCLARGPVNFFFFFLADNIYIFSGYS